jgi:hypothetical protein
MARLVIKAARQFGRTPSELLRVEDEWQALALDLTLIAAAEADEATDIQREVQSMKSQKGDVFPTFDSMTGIRLKWH